MSNRLDDLSVRCRWLLPSLALLCLAVLHADDLRPPDVREAQRIQLRNQTWRDLLTGLKLSGGYTCNYRPGGEDGGYYKVSYDGQLLSPSATPIERWATQPVERAVMTRVDLTDLPAQTVRVEDGTLHDDGALLLFEALRRSGRGGYEGAGRQLTGGLRVTNDDELGRYALSVSGESMPLRLPTRSGEETPNWLTVGLRFDRAEYSEGMGEDTSWGSVTYRAQWDKALAYSAPPKSYQDEYARRITAAARGCLAGNPQGWKALAANGPYTVFAEMERLDDKFADDDARLRRAARNIAATDDTFARLRLQLADEGSYGFLGTPDGNRFANVFTATLVYYLLSGSESSYLQARYELGNDPASPTERKNVLMLSFNLEF